MRADMKKVLCERPRARAIYSYHDFRAVQKSADYDDMPSHQGMRRPYADDPKEFSDLLGPLYRYIHGSIGRRWDDMWSELCANVPGDTITGRHLREHARTACDTNTCVVDNKVYSRGSRFSSGLMEPSGLYVDPRDGIVCFIEKTATKYNLIIVDGLGYVKRDDGVLCPHATWGRWHSGSRTGRYPLKVIGDQRAMYINGIWYWIIIEETPPPSKVAYVVSGKIKYRMVEYPRYDFIKGEFVTGRYHANKRQMSHSDLRRHGLRNVAGS